MILNVLSLAALYAIMKYVTLYLNSNQAVFLYKSSLFLLILPWVFYKDGLNAIKTPNLKLHFYRGIFSTAGSLTLMHSLNYLKLVDITVLTHLEQVLWLIIGAVFFSEKLSFSKIAAIIFGFAGGFFITRPETAHNLIFIDKIEVPEFNNAYIFIAATICFWSINSSLVKVLGNRQASNKAQLFYVMLFSSIFSCIAAFTQFEWQTSTPNHYIPKIIILPLHIQIEELQVAYIAFAALLYLIHSVAFFKAMKHGEMTVIAPFVYFKLLFAALFGYFVFGEAPATSLSYIGYLLIVLAGIIVTLSQYRHHKKKIKLR